MGRQGISPILDHMAIHNIESIAWKAQPACYEGSLKHGNP